MVLIIDTLNQELPDDEMNHSYKFGVSCHSLWYRKLSKWDPQPKQALVCPQKSLLEDYWKSHAKLQYIPGNLWNLTQRSI